MNKRGVSAIVATVLIVLITVAAVTLLWTAISPLIDKNLSGGTSCFSVQNKLSIDVNKQHTCWNISGNPSTIKLRIEREANTPDLAGFEIIIDDNGDSIINDSLTDDASVTSNALTENGKKIYNFNLGSPLTGPIKASIAPRVNQEGEIISCSATYPVEINQC